jgi:hypothetical protein
MDSLSNGKQSPIDKVIRFCLENKLVVALFVILVIGAGVMVAPFAHSVTAWNSRGKNDSQPVDVRLFVDIRYFRRGSRF